MVISEENFLVPLVEFMKFQLTEGLGQACACTWDVRILRTYIPIKPERNISLHTELQYRRNSRRTSIIGNSTRRMF